MLQQLQLLGEERTIVKAVADEGNVVMMMRRRVGVREDIYKMTDQRENIRQIKDRDRISD